MTDDVDVMTSSKPYLLRAIYEWILDNQMTPHLMVDAAFPDARVPAEFVEDGRIVLNISPSAVRGLVIGNDWIELSARFGGAAREILVPTEAVIGIFTRENGQGMVFPEPRYPETQALPDAEEPPQSGPKLEPIPQGSGDAGGKPGGPSSPRGKGKGKGGPSLKVVK